MMTNASKVIMTVILLTFANTATAEDMGHAPWQIDLGVTRLAMVDKADVAAVGTQIPGAGVDSDAQVVPSITVTRFVTATVGFSLASGLPPRIRYNGSGTLASAGRLIDVRYAAPALTIVWSPFRTRGIAPYVGAGATYMHVLSTRDGALQGSEVDDDLGPVAQAGVTFFSGRRWGIYADVKKAFVRTKAYGLFGPAPVEARLRMDPVVALAGVALRL
jgi:outer membrane protein